MDSSWLRERRRSASTRAWSALARSRARYGLALSATVASAPTHRSRQLNFTSQTSLNFGDAAYGGGGVAGIAAFSWGTPQPYRPRSHGRRQGRGAGCLSQRRADGSSADHADGVAALAGRWSRLGRPAASR